MIKEALNSIRESKPKIFRDGSKDKWDLEGMDNYINKIGLSILGIGLLEKFFKTKKDATYIFTNLFKGEEAKGKEFLDGNPNKNEILCRYASNSTIAGGMTPLCILNSEKGYMRYLENIDDDPELEDAEWSKPQYFNYLRVLN